MFWPLTLLGVVAGGWLASVPGALLGGLLGLLADRLLKRVGWRSLLGPRRLPAIQALQFAMLGRLAKANGRVSEAHIRQARDEMHRLQLEPAAVRLAIAQFGRGKAGLDDPRAGLRRLRQRPDDATRLLKACWRMANLGGGASGAERALILQWGDWMGWEPARIDALNERPSRPRPASNRQSEYDAALAMLGVERNTDPKLIKQAYRRQVSRYHPDKLTGAGATPAQIQAATERTRRLQAAYALIRERRGFR